MPTVFRYKGYRFFFFSNEGIPREALHIHVRKGSATAKIWLEPKISVAESYQINPNELAELLRVVLKNRKLIERAWNEFFSE